MLFTIEISAWYKPEIDSDDEEAPTFTIQSSSPPVLGEMIIISSYDGVPDIFTKKSTVLTVDEIGRVMRDGKEVFRAKGFVIWEGSFSKWLKTFQLMTLSVISFFHFPKTLIKSEPWYIKEHSFFFLLIKYSTSLYLDFTKTKDREN